MIHSFFPLDGKVNIKLDRHQLGIYTPSPLPTINRSLLPPLRQANILCRNNSKELDACFSTKKNKNKKQMLQADHQHNGSFYTTSTSKEASTPPSPLPTQHPHRPSSSVPKPIHSTLISPSSNIRTGFTSLSTMILYSPLAG